MSDYDGVVAPMNVVDEPTLLALVRKWRSILLLGRWRIEVRRNSDPDCDSFCSIQQIGDDEDAVLIYTGDLATVDRGMEYYIAHELCHLIPEPIDSLMEDLKATMGFSDQMAAFVERLHQRAVERIVDHLTEIVTKLEGGV